ncbi:MAG: four-carbon acid sugar kinase family protein, partial [Phycisphaerae bacterium]|nr:four-carbon acid sugar kinase family protein [Phycisphaerae bacterium]
MRNATTSSKGRTVESRSRRVVALLAAVALLPAFARSAPAQLSEAAAASAKGGTGENPPTPPDLEELLTGVSLDGQAINIPIVGRIGTEVVADGFEFLAERRDALAKAKVLILDIDSEMGNDADGHRIAAALESIRERVPIVVLVRRAIGPSALLLPVANRVL